MSISTVQTKGKVSVATLGEIESEAAWKQAFGQQRKDWRYYKIVEETLHQGFEHRYFLLENDRGERAVQPFFMHNQDLLAGSAQWVQNLIARPRKIFPRLLTMRTLMVGCAAGEGRLDADSEERAAWIGELLARHLKEHSRRLRCGMVVMKEFHVETRAALQCFKTSGFTFVPSLPMTRLSIDYASFEEYMTKALSKVTRKGLRRKFRAANDAKPITREVVTDISAAVDEVYPLYMAVYERSPLHFEKLTKEFLCRLGWEIPDKVRYFIWRQEGKAVAFSLCMMNGDTLYDEYLGLDYSVALDLHLYFHTIRDIIEWAMAQGLKWYCSSALNYDPKLHLKCRLEPLDLYVAHTSAVVNFFLAKFLPILEPTRNDKTLRQFPNFADLWGAK
ncbi:MAG: GNAT family N-acetyltransferase [Tepidisphaeraceae bacterium]|jgi:predicted N-acyltransferase